MKMKWFNEYKWPLLVVVIVALLWACFPYMPTWVFPRATGIEFRAQFGDSYGVLNTLFSGLAFTGIIFSILIQSRELKATNKSFEDLAAESEKQRLQFEKQSNVMDRQLFEGTFFQLIKLHNEVVESISKKAFNDFEHQVFKGRSALESISKEWDHTVKSYRFERDLNTYGSQFQVFFNERESMLAPYFGNINQVLIYLSGSDLNTNKYLCIFKAQFTESELRLIYAYCLMNLPADGFKELIEEFSFFSNFVGQDEGPPHKCEFEADAFIGGLQEVPVL